MTQIFGGAVIGAVLMWAALWIGLYVTAWARQLRRSVARRR